jgi:hypothetical protein
MEKSKNETAGQALKPENALLNPLTCPPDGAGHRHKQHLQFSMTVGTARGRRRQGRIAGLSHVGGGCRYIAGRVGPTRVQMIQ